jgi:predicted RNase H-like nuclease (RuvC/YqgF family)
MSKDKILVEVEKIDKLREQIDKLRQENKELENQIKDYQEDFKEYQEDVDKLRKENDALKQRVQDQQVLLDDSIYSSDLRRALEGKEAVGNDELVLEVRELVKLVGSLRGRIREKRAESEEYLVDVMDHGVQIYIKNVEPTDSTAGYQVLCIEEIGIPASPIALLSVDCADANETAEKAINKWADSIAESVIATAPEPPCFSKEDQIESKTEVRREEDEDG